VRAVLAAKPYLARDGLRFGACRLGGGFRVQGLVELPLAGGDVALEAAQQAVPQRVQPLAIQDAGL